jgi:predicted SAM-dependent methyltransferase
MYQPLKGFLKQVIPSSMVAFVKKMKSKTLIEDRLRQTQAIYLEMGAGAKQGKNGWITLDMNKECDLYWDLRDGIPFPNESISKIYSSHLFEHLSYQEGQKLLGECLRVLIPGGWFSICVPNARIYVEAYLKSEVLDEHQFFQYKPGYYGLSGIDYLNYIAYMDGEHKHMFDEENLVAVLRQQFKNPCLRAFDPGLDRPERDFESIYAEVQKQ